MAFNLGMIPEGQGQLFVSRWSMVFKRHISVPSFQGFSELGLDWKRICDALSKHLHKAVAAAAATSPSTSRGSAGARHNHNCHIVPSVLKGLCSEAIIIQDMGPTQENGNSSTRAYPIRYGGRSGN